MKYTFKKKLVQLITVVRVISFPNHKLQDFITL